MISPYLRPFSIIKQKDISALAACTHVGLKRDDSIVRRNIGHAELAAHDVGHAEHNSLITQRLRKHVHPGIPQWMGMYRPEKVQAIRRICVVWIG